MLRSFAIELYDELARYTLEQAPESPDRRLWMVKMQPSARKTAAG
jgi:hypothetical protein